MKKELLTAVKTLVFMFISTLLLLLLVSFIYYKFRISDGKIIAGVIIIYFLSTFIGGFIYGKIKEKNKFLYGMAIGAVYFAVLFIVSLLLKDEMPAGGAGMIYAILSCLLGGMIGGMLG